MGLQCSEGNGKSWAAQCLWLWTNPQGQGLAGSGQKLPLDLEFLILAFILNRVFLLNKTSSVLGSYFASLLVLLLHLFI